MTEEAVLIAQRWLSHPPGFLHDPNCDECVLAREYLRVLEQVHPGFADRVKIKEATLPLGLD